MLEIKSYKNIEVKTADEFIHAIINGFWSISFPDEIRADIDIELSNRIEEDDLFLAKHLITFKEHYLDNYLDKVNYLVSKNNKVGINLLAVHYYKNKDIDNYIKYTKIAMELGYAPAFRNMALEYSQNSVNKDPAKMMYYLKQGTKYDYAPTFKMIANNYLVGYGCKVSYKFALYYFERAYECNDLSVKSTIEEIKEVLKDE